MNDDIELRTSRVLSAINFVLGIWLAVSPYVLDYLPAQARWQQTIGGLVIAVLAAIRYYRPDARWADWTNAAVALWLIVAPFVSGYQTVVAYGNEIIAALLVGGVALWNAGLGGTTYYSHHGRTV